MREKSFQKRSLNEMSNEEVPELPHYEEINFDNSLEDKDQKDFVIPLEDIEIKAEPIFVELDKENIQNSEEKNDKKEFQEIKIKPLPKIEKKEQEEKINDEIKKEVYKVKENLEESEKIENKGIKEISEEELKNFPTLKLKSEREIAMDFAQKVYLKFDKLIKAVILFGSAAKKTNVLGSDIDIIIIVDDAIVKFDEKLVFWYREELGDIIKKNPYARDLHINTVKLSTWWLDLYRGDPTVINVIRYGEALIDFGGFFNPLKILLEEGKIRPTPEAIYNCLNRVPFHLTRSRQAQISAIEGCYWAMVDSAQALLMTLKITPPSPEHIPLMLKENLVDKNLLKMKYVIDFRDIYDLYKKMMHGELHKIEGKVIDEWQKKSQEFFDVSVKLIKELLI